MDKDLALILLNACNRCSRELGELMPYIRDHCTPEEQAVLRRAIGGSIADIMQNIAAYVESKSPEAKAEIERRFSKYERVV